ncbi:MAG: hypothetical protein R3350_10350, partial [Saprospiraceae bacterium]|nr:hypothetical protein [Saprospiraceae bacterium]
RRFEVPARLLEDEIFNRLRMDPASLPTGEVEVLPSTVFVRLKHRDFEPVRVEAEMATYEGEVFPSDTFSVYRLRYVGEDRTLEIVFDPEPPYRIEGWIDSYPSVFDREVRRTVARRTETIKNAYWEKNAPEDRALREKLGMESME